MNAIGPGDWVECVNAKPRYVRGYGWCETPELDECAVYLVVGLPPTDAWGDDGVYLQGLTGGFALVRFRPIYRPSAGLIEGLLRPVPADAPADLVRAS